MATAFKRLQKQLEELGAELAAEAGGEGGQRSALQRRADAQRIAGQLAELREPVRADHAMITSRLTALPTISRRGCRKRAAGASWYVRATDDS